MFATALGMSQIAPVLPLYIKMLGVIDTASIERLSGIAFGSTFIISAIFSPVWGRAADKFGRKPMLLRASLGMAIVIFAMGFVQNVYQLMGLRLLQGVITGYSTACMILIAVQTPKKNAGWALGTLATAGVSGSLFGPLLGGYLAEIVGMRGIFFITGGFMMVAFITTLLWVKETFVRSEQKVQSFGAIWRQIPDPGLVLTLFLISFIAPVGLYSIEPIITVYVAKLTQNETHVALISGMTFAAAGLAGILSSPRLGKLSDKIGPHKVMLIALVAAGVLMVPQAWVTNPWQLIGLRFLLGLAVAGIMPALNTLLKHSIPASITGRMFGINMSAQYLGVFGGSVLGGQVAAFFGIQSVFFVTSALLLINALLMCKIVFRKKPAAANRSVV